MCKFYSGFGGVRGQILASISVLPDWKSLRESATKLTRNVSKHKKRKWQSVNYVKTKQI